MIATDLINQLIPPLRNTDSVDKALQWMEEFRVKELPIVNAKVYSGMMSEEVLYDCNLPDATIGDLPPIHEETFVYANQHIYEVLRRAEEKKLDVLAVLNDEDEFMGAITLTDTLQGLTRSFAMQSPGGIVVLSMFFRDYSLAQIARLVEENNAKILSAFVEEDPQDEGRIRLTLKLNTDDLNAIIATFERFDYQVLAKFQSDKNDEDWSRDRVDFFFKYLDL